MLYWKIFAANFLGLRLLSVALNSLSSLFSGWGKWDALRLIYGNSSFSAKIGPTLPIINLSDLGEEMTSCTCNFRVVITDTYLCWTTTRGTECYLGRFTQSVPWREAISLERLSVVLLGQAGIILLSSKEAPEISFLAGPFCLNLAESCINLYSLL